MAKKKGLHERYVSLLGFLSRFLFQRKTHYKPYSPRRWTSPFRFWYLNDSIPVRQQGIHQIPKRHPRLFQAVVSCGVFLGPMYDVRRWRHLHRVKPHKVSKMKIWWILKGKNVKHSYLKRIWCQSYHFLSLPLFHVLRSFCGILIIDRLVWL